MTRYQADLLPRLLCALMQTRSARSVNLKQVAAVLWGSATPASHYRRLQRFVGGTWSPQVGTQLIVAQVVKPGKADFVDLGSHPLAVRPNPSQSVMLRGGSPTRLDPD